MNYCSEKVSLQIEFVIMEGIISNYISWKAKQVNEDE